MPSMILVVLVSGLGSPEPERFFDTAHNEIKTQARPDAASLANFTERW